MLLSLDQINQAYEKFESRIECGKTGINLNFLVEIQIKQIFQIQYVCFTSIHLFNIFCLLTLMTQIISNAVPLRRKVCM